MTFVDLLTETFANELSVSQLTKVIHTSLTYFPNTSELLTGLMKHLGSMSVNLLYGCMYF